MKGLHTVFKVLLTGLVTSSTHSSDVGADLADTVGGLDAELEWSHVLSLGEQQRLAFLRLLLHEPSLAFLDEATGALDNATEASCYKALHKHSTSFVSVGKSAHIICLSFAIICEILSHCVHSQVDATVIQFWDVFLHSEQDNRT